MNISTELLIIDQVPLFSEARDAFEKAYQSIARLKADLHQHESEDLPAYNRWVHGTFGKYLTRARELAAMIQEKENLLIPLRERHWERFFGGVRHHHSERGMGREEPGGEATFCDMHATWQTFEDGDEEGEYGPQHEETRYERANSFFDDEDELHFSEDSEAVRRFEDLFRRRSTEDRGGGRYSSGPSREECKRARRAASLDEEGGTEPSAHQLSEAELLLNRLKETYRLLVRKLHPDVNPDLTAEEKSLWNQVQAAYQQKNPEQLDLLLALSNVYSGRMGRDSSLYQLRRATREVERLVAPLRRKLEEASKHHAWKFSQGVDRAALFRKVERQFQRELAEMRERLARLDQQLKRFASQGE